MISRGYFIGQIIDDLSDVSSRIDARCAIGLTDLNIYAEDFYSRILNEVLDLNLSNLNLHEGSNNPGLDLGDATAGTAFQITSNATLQKVRKTLEKIDDKSLETYPTIYIFVAGKKQGSYALGADETHVLRTKFKLDHIWDHSDLTKALVDLPLDRLQRLHKLITDEVARVKIELEIPRSDGTYPTSILNYVEEIPLARIGDCSSFESSEGGGLFDDAAEAKECFERLSKRLSALPRITRECLGIIIDRGAHGSFGSRDDIYINGDALMKIVRSPDLEGDINILIEQSFLQHNEPFGSRLSYYFTVQFPGTPSAFELSFSEYLKTKKLSAVKVLGSLDFSAF